MQVIAQGSGSNIFRALGDGILGNVLGQVVGTAGNAVNGALNGVGLNVDQANFGAFGRNFNYNNWGGNQRYGGGLFGGNQGYGGYSPYGGYQPGFNQGFNPGFGGLFNRGYNQPQYGAYGLLQEMVHDLGQAADVNGRNLEKNAQKTYQQGLEFANKFAALAPTGVLTLNQPFAARANGRDVYLAPGNYTADVFASRVLSQANVESPETIGAIGTAIQQVMGARGQVMAAAGGQAQAAPLDPETARQLVQIADYIKAASLEGHNTQQYMAIAISQFNALKNAQGEVIVPPGLNLGMPDGRQFGMVPPGAYTMPRLAEAITALTPGTPEVEAAVKAAAAAAGPAADASRATGTQQAGAPAGFQQASFTTNAAAAETPAAAAPVSTTESRATAARGTAMNYGAGEGMPPINADMVETVQKIMLAAGAELPNHGADAKWGPETQRAYLNLAGKDAGKIDFTDPNNPATQAFMASLKERAAARAPESPAPTQDSKVIADATAAAKVPVSDTASKTADVSASAAGNVGTTASPSPLFGTFAFASDSTVQLKPSAGLPKGLGLNLDLPKDLNLGIASVLDVSTHAAPGSSPAAAAQQAKLAVGGVNV